MRLAKYSRVALMVGVLSMVAALSACSSGGEKSSSGSGSGGSAGGASQAEYCAAIQSFVDLMAPYGTTPPPAEIAGEVTDIFARASTAAPSEVASDLQKSLAGDSYAKDNVDLYNETKCGLDTSRFRPSS